MSKLISRSALLLLSLALLAGAAAGQGSKSKRQKSRRAGQTTAAKAKQPEPEPVMTVGEDGVRRITAEEARKAFDSGSAVIVDVRGEASYNAGHIKGSLLMPVETVSSRAAELPQGKLIITYCS